MCQSAPGGWPTTVGPGQAAHPHRPHDMCLQGSAAGLQPAASDLDNIDYFKHLPCYNKIHDTRLNYLIKTREVQDLHQRGTDPHWVEDVAGIRAIYNRRRTVQTRPNPTWVSFGYKQSCQRCPHQGKPSRVITPHPGRAVSLIR